MKKDLIIKIFRTLFVIIFMVGMLFPASLVVRAEGSEPPPVEEPAPPVEEPAPAIEEPAPAADETSPSAEEPAPAADETSPSAEEPAPAAEEPAPAVEEPAPAADGTSPSGEEAAPASEEVAPVTEEVVEVTDEAAPQAEDVVETTEEAAPESEEVAPEVEDLTEVVEVLDEADVVLVDAAGDAVPLASQEAVEILTAPDPIGCPAGVTPTTMGGTGAGCTDPYTSINAAIIDIKVIDDGTWTIYVEYGDYAEDVVINKQVALMGFKPDGSATTKTAAIAQSFTLQKNVVSSTNIFAPLVYVQTGGSIQDAVALVQDNGTVNIAAGTYDETINLENRDGITINGENKDTVIIQPTSTLNWNWSGDDLANSGAKNQQAVVRVVNSTDIKFQNLTFDFAKIKDNFHYGMFILDSTATVNNNILKNMSDSDLAGKYREYGVAVRTNVDPGSTYTDSNRALVNFTDNEFIDAGRVAVHGRGYTNMLVDHNTFYKTLDDFGYAIEPGTMASATIINNTIYGYDTPAASDNSISAAIYVENCFTTGKTASKNVTITGNEIFGNQYGIVIGNEFNNFAGNVDIVANVANNNIHDNTDVGIQVSDEDKANGSSVNATFQNNVLTNNPKGYLISTFGDGDITASLSGEKITGGNVAMQMDDYGTVNNSTYNVSIGNSDLSGNTWAVQNNTTPTINASNNWWGLNNPAAIVNLFTGNVDYSPWLASGTDTSAAAGFQGDYSSLYVDAASLQAGAVPGNLQEGINSLLTGGTLHLSNGTYIEQLDINKNITLQGDGAAIIQAPATITNAYTGHNGLHHPLVYIHDASNVVVDNVTLDGARTGTTNNRLEGIAYQNAGGTISNSTIKNMMHNNLSGVQGGYGIYAYNTNGLNRTLNIFDNTIVDFQKNGIMLIGNGLSADVEGNTITGAGLTNLIAQNGIVFYNGSSGTIKDNGISNMFFDSSNSSTDWTASGILLMNTDGTTLVQGNTVQNTQTALFASDARIDSKYNVLIGDGLPSVTYPNGFNSNDTAVIFEDTGTGKTANSTMSGEKITGFDAAFSTNDSSVSINNSSLSNNAIFGWNNGAGTIDASNNWWGSITPAAIASLFTGNVDYSPWLASGTDTSAAAGFQGDYSSLYVNAASPQAGAVPGNLQEGINSLLTGGTLNVAPGLYNERIVVNRSMTLLGATSAVNKNGYLVPAGYAWDPTVESIINNPNDGLVEFGQVVDILNTNNVVFDGFVVQALNVPGVKNEQNLLRVYAGTQNVDNVIVRNSVIGPNTNTTNQPGNFGRMGLYLAAPSYGPYGITNSLFTGNKIFDVKGNGNNVFVWGSALNYGAQRGDFTGTVISNNEIYGSHRSGIEIAGSADNLTIQGNTIYNNTGFTTDAANALRYGNGIVVIRMGSDSALPGGEGANNLAILNNTIYGNQKNGIYLGPVLTNARISGNNIFNNGWNGVWMDQTETYHGGTSPVYNRTQNVDIDSNRIVNNTVGVSMTGVPTNGFVLNATNNWWGSNAGPNTTGLVDASTWLKYGPLPSHNVINTYGTTTVSAPIMYSSGDASFAAVTGLPWFVSPATLMLPSVLGNWDGSNFTASDEIGWVYFYGNLDGEAGTAGIKIVKGSAPIFAGGGVPPYVPAGGLPGAGGVIPVTGANIIPVTGAEAVDLRCGLNQLVLSNGIVANVNGYCGDYSATMAGLTEGTLPDSVSPYTFVSGVTLNLLAGSNPLEAGPDGATITYSLPSTGMPEGSTPKVLYWDPTLNGGAGGWIEYSGATVVSEDGFVQFSPNLPGTYVVVYE